MEILNQESVLARKQEILEAIQSGKIFIYPTDTIYGLGCSALLGNAVSKIRAIKERDNKPFSVIAPSKAWIKKYCAVLMEDVDKYLPGPYTLLVKRIKEAVAKEVNPNDETLGVRIPKHWFASIVQEAGVPFITTSVNVSGEPHMEKLEDVKPEILNQVDYVIDEGEIKGARSEKVDLL